MDFFYLMVNCLLFHGLFCRVYELEKRVKTPEKYLFPNFETLHWYAAKHILDEIKGKVKNGFCSPC